MKENNQYIGNYEGKYKGPISQLLNAQDYDEFLELSKNYNNADLTLYENLLITNRLNDLRKEKYYEETKIKFTYSDDEYGEIAKELHKEIGIPKYAYPGDAGFDLPIVLSKDDMKNGSQIIWPNERGILHTGMIFEFPVGYHGRIIHRSSCEKNYRLRVIEGIIDDYRGQVLIQVANQNTCQVIVKHGNRLAQMVILPNSGFNIAYSDVLRVSKRNNSGFGSSGT
jgi:dUTP pyrophosphatase